MGHPVFARIYARVRPQMDAQGVAAHRARLLAGLSGAVVEIGCGDGGNFGHYPPSVTSVLAVEPEPYLRARAESAPASVPVQVVDGTADRLPLAENSMDAVVTSLVLCSVPDQATTLAEARRVLRPDGELRFYEHVAGMPGRLQRVLDATIYPALSGGCHLHRDTLGAITAAGFTVTEVDRFDFPATGFNPAAPHILGRATKAGG
ncbi:methyltransferase domain-containing protein [Kribbella sandramycini]|uniref:Methyltransferase domain-containing protein n=1 Tax=Kribbella sandramycini TaxID=60450 RepID=A0A7Y4L6Y5_9ACTN|nr:class I SAM-dependent methyltransferase [Kribbella sandramycini]MBB6566809.1 ubiquinone/menaquinone biosynthesis C-methylase UbiE [Kribbella sandramycini]NOL44532.1 methyltransferase domain-containing protein [Kribbella sandramycini]